MITVLLTTCSLNPETAVTFTRGHSTTCNYQYDPT